MNEGRASRAAGYKCAYHSLMPGNAVNVWQPEAVAAIKSLKLFVSYLRRVTGKAA
jgi:hypothetical protein